MKRLFLILLILLSTIFMTSCNDIPLPGIKKEPNIFMEKEIVLGEEVSSLKVLNNQGEEITVDYSLSFFELYNSLNPFFASKENKIVSYSGEIQGENDIKSYVHLNIYQDELSMLFHYETSKEGSDDVATVMEYNYLETFIDEEENEVVSSRMEYSKYTYKDDKAFGGFEENSNGIVNYKNEKYPIVPTTGSELNDMYVRSIILKNYVGLIDNLFPQYGVIDSINVGEKVTSSYKLYENYIVFEQDNPYLSLLSEFYDGRLYPQLLKISNGNYSNKVTAYYNIKTGEIETVTLVGQTYIKVVDRMFDTNITINVFDLDENKYLNKVESLVVYVRGNSTKQTN